MNVTLAQWDALSSPERDSLARALLEQFPEEFAFDGLHPQRCGEAAREVAMYRLGDAHFALVPGGTFTLGFDVGDWQPYPEESESFLASAEENQIEGSIQDYIASVTLRPRSVVVPSLLVEVEARELGWRAIGLNDPLVRELMSEYGAQATVESSSGEVSTRIRPGCNGVTLAERAYAEKPGDFAAALAAEGFRFPTSDEWEYLCGAGEPTLFRWGDHLPEEPKRGEPDSVSQPNAFGLTIACNMYHYEMVAEAGVTRGGDGGRTACGGGGMFLESLILASAWFDEGACCHDPDEPFTPGHLHGRRVLELK